MNTKNNLRIGFSHTPGSFKVLGEVGRHTLASFSSTFKGKEYVGIHKCWTDDNGFLQPGKGLSVLLSEKEELVTALTNWVNDQKPNKERKLKAVS